MIFNKGFSMIELIIVILILSILSVVSINKFHNVKSYNHIAFYDEVRSSIYFAKLLSINSRCYVEFITTGDSYDVLIATNKADCKIKSATRSRRVNFDQPLNGSGVSISGSVVFSPEGGSIQGGVIDVSGKIIKIEKSGYIN